MSRWWLVILGFKGFRNYSGNNPCNWSFCRLSRWHSSVLVASVALSKGRWCSATESYLVPWSWLQYSWYLLSLQSQLKERYLWPGFSMVLPPIAIAGRPLAYTLYWSHSFSQKFKLKDTELRFGLDGTFVWWASGVSVNVAGEVKTTADNTWAQKGWGRRACMRSHLFPAQCCAKLTCTCCLYEFQR